MTATWREEYVGGSPEAERREFERLAGMVTAIQRRNSRAAGASASSSGVDRAFHAKQTAAVVDAELRFLDVPPDLQVGFARPQATYPAVVRFSNAAGVRRPDPRPDVRGVSLRIEVSPEEQHDLLLASFPVFFAGDLRQLVALTRFSSSGGAFRALALMGLLRVYGPRGFARTMRNIRRAERQPVGSLATQTYWGQGAIRWGGTLAVRYLLRPVLDGPPDPGAPAPAPDYLSRELADRLSRGDVRFELSIQRFRDERSTPIEDASAEWPEEVSPAEPVAVLTIARRDPGAARARTGGPAVEAMAFSVWNTTDEFRPLGSVNRARRMAYDASAAQRRGARGGDTGVTAR